MAIRQGALISLRTFRGTPELNAQDTFFDQGSIEKRAFLAAIGRNDLDFFLRVGNVLRKRQPHLLELVEASRTNLQQFLIDHWASEKDRVPPLYNLPIQKLTELCQKHLIPSLTPFVVEKTRQRLGLRTFRKGRLQAA